MPRLKGTHEEISDLKKQLDIEKRDEALNNIEKLQRLLDNIAGKLENDEIPSKQEICDMDAGAALVSNQVRRLEWDNALDDNDQNDLNKRIQDLFR